MSVSTNTLPLRCITSPVLTCGLCFWRSSALLLPQPLPSALCSLLRFIARLLSKTKPKCTPKQTHRRKIPPRTKSFLKMCPHGYEWMVLAKCALKPFGFKFDSYARSPLSDTGMPNETAFSSLRSNINGGLE